MMAEWFLKNIFLISPQSSLSSHVSTFNNYFGREIVSPFSVLSVDCLIYVI